MRILIVDDSRVMRSIVTRTLRQAGYGDHDVTEAANGLQALDAVQKAAPDLVLCDWNMPEMDGLELLTSLRRAGNAVPFGFVTTEGTEEMRQRAAAAGASFLIAKPFTADTFREYLEPVLA
jgi:two-component system, chemotaxis family, chemotaxis protein CheY